MSYQKKLFLIFVFLFLPLFFFSCLPSRTPEIANLTAEENLTLNQTPAVVGPCLPGWKCIGKWLKAYQYENCSWSPSRLECPLGCLNNTCVTGKSCPSGFKCLDESRLAYQTEDCLFTNIKRCEWRCQNSECLPFPANYTPEINQTQANITTEAIKETKTPEPPKEDIRTLNFGETATLEISGIKYNLTIHNIEASRAILQLDNFQSDWLSDNGNFTFSLGITIFIKEILFQPWGTKSVSYVVKS